MWSFLLLLFAGLVILTAGKNHKVGEKCMVGNDTGIWHDRQKNLHRGRCCINVTCPAGYEAKLCNNSNGLGVAQCTECQDGKFKPGPTLSADMHQCQNWTKCSGDGCIITKKATTTSNYEWRCDHSNGYYKLSAVCLKMEEECPPGQYLPEGKSDCYQCPSWTFKSEPGYHECSPVTNCTDEEKELEPYTATNDTVCRNKSLPINDTDIVNPTALPNRIQNNDDNVKIIAISVTLTGILVCVCIALMVYCCRREKRLCLKELLLRQSLTSTTTSSTDGVGNKAADSTSEGSDLTKESSETESLINLHKVVLGDGQGTEDPRMLTKTEMQMSPDSPRQSNHDSVQYEVEVEGHGTGQGQEEFEVHDGEEDDASNIDGTAQLGNTLGGAGRQVINIIENVNCNQLVIGDHNTISQTPCNCNGNHPPAPRATSSAESQLPRSDRYSTENDEQIRCNINDKYPNVHVSNLYTRQTCVHDLRRGHEGMETLDVLDSETADTCVIQQETGPLKDDEYFDQNVIVPVEETGPAKDYHSLS